MYSANGDFYKNSHIIENMNNDIETVVKTRKLPQNVKINIGTSLYKNGDLDGYPTKRVYNDLEFFQPSFNIKQNNEINNIDEKQYNYANINMSFAVSSIKKNNIILKLTTNTHFKIIFNDNDHTYMFMNNTNNFNIKDHTIVINRNISTYNVNNDIIISINLPNFNLNSDTFIITNFNDVIKKLK